MADFKFIKVVDFNKIEISSWKWNSAGLAGTLIEIKGIRDTSDEVQKQIAQQRLESLLSGNKINLKRPEQIEGRTDVIRCEVYLDNINITNYFPDFSD